MQKTGETRNVCMGYFVLFMLLHETDFWCLKLSRSRSGNYAPDIGTFSCDKGWNSTRKSNCETCVVNFCVISCAPFFLASVSCLEDVLRIVCSRLKNSIIFALCVCIIPGCRIFYQLLLFESVNTSLEHPVHLK